LIFFNPLFVKITFSTEDIKNYYDHTEAHYRQFWKLDESMGLHYGIWDHSTRTLAEAIRNTNAQLAKMGNIQPSDSVPRFRVKFGRRTTWGPG